MIPRVAVIGAGPAGVSAARVLGPHISTVLFERGRPGKDKPCGDALMPEAVDWLNLCGISLTELRQCSGVPFNSVDLNCQSQSISDVSAGGTGCIIRRAILDQKLRATVENLVDLRYNTLISSISRNKRAGWVVSARSGTSSTTFVCDAVIIATGSHVSVRGAEEVCHAGEVGVALSAYVGCDSELLRPTFNFAQSAKSYSWRFPCNVADNIGFCTLFASPPSEHRRKIYEMRQERGKTTRHTLRGGLVKLWSAGSQIRNSDDGLISCGDAAGLVDPYSAEGISAALESGHLAAQAVLTYLGSSRPRSLRDYSDWISRRFAKKYASSREFWVSVGVLSASHPIF